MPLKYFDSHTVGDTLSRVTNDVDTVGQTMNQCFSTLIFYIPYFKAMGASWLLVGGCGCGSITKLSNQIIVNLTIAAVSEALVLATKARADPDRIYQAIRGGLAGSAVLDAKAPMMLARNFVPSGKIAINLKDIKNVMSSAHAMDVPLPMTAQLLEIMQSLKVGCHLNDDHSGIVQYFESLAGVEVKAGGMEAKV